MRSGVRLLQPAALFFLVFPSLGLVQRMGQGLLAWLGAPGEWVYYGAMAGVLAYAVVAAWSLERVLPLAVAYCQRDLRTRSARYLLLALLAGLLALFLWCYPVLTSGVFGGGSDRDEALNIAVRALLRGDYPYYELTFVPGIPHERGLDGNPISPMPGELILAMPFVLLGNGAYQTFFWFGVTALLLQPVLGGWQRVLVFMAALPLVSPSVLHEAVTGGDLFVNGLWIFCAVLMIVQCRARALLMASAAFLGLALSSRMHFLLVAPIVAGIACQYHGSRMALQLALVAGLSFLIVTIPFYLYDPAGFSPLHAYAKIGKFDAVLPHAGVIVPLLAGAAAITAMVVMRGRSLGCWGLAYAAVLSTPVLFGTTLRSVELGRLDFVDFSWYGLSWIALPMVRLFEDGRLAPCRRQA